MKFSEAPRFLLDEFFDGFTLSEPATGDYTFIEGITTPSYSYFDLIVEKYISEDNSRYYIIPFIPYTPTIVDENFFYVQRCTTFETSATSAIEIDIECPVYLKKSSIEPDERTDTTDGSTKIGSLFDVFMRQKAEADSTFLDFVNVQKPFTYIGRIYPEDNNGDYFRIEYWGIDRYAISCLPPHLQTEKIKRFFKLYFDEIYNRVYNRQKFVITLLDALEVDLNFIDYLADLYGISLEKDYIDSLYKDMSSSATRKNERILREYVRELPNSLKRKGTYASLYILFKNLFYQTSNKIAIYERWHSNDLCNGWPDDPNAIPSSPSGQFVDFDYLTYYGECTDSCVPSGYNEPIVPVGFNTPATNCYIHRQSFNSDSWFIMHMLGHRLPVVQCFDNELNLLQPNEIISIDEYCSWITFGTGNKNKGYALFAIPHYSAMLTSHEELLSTGIDQMVPIVEGYESDSYIQYRYYNSIGGCIFR